MLSDGLFGALIGGGVALVTGLLTNGIVAWNLYRQHKHDAKQKVEDRKAALRREVYLKVVEDIHALHADMGNIQNRPIEDSDTTAFQSVLQSTGKLWIVAEYETTVLSRNYVNLISEAYFTAIVQSSPVRNAVARVHEAKRVAQDARAAANAAEQILVRADVEFAQGIDVNSHANEAAEKSVWADAAQRAFEQAVEDCAPLRQEHSLLVFSGIRKGNPAFVKLITALRKEIGLDSNEEAFMGLIQEQEKRATKVFADAFGGNGGAR